MMLVGWSVLFAAALSLDRPNEWFGGLASAFAVFWLMVLSAILGGGFLLAKLREAMFERKIPRWEARDRDDVH